jgi:hypothetical protein
MFQYYWPEEVACEKCQEIRDGATLYISEEPLYSVCSVCDPDASQKAISYSKNLAEEDLANGWEWLKITKNS